MARLRPSFLTLRCVPPPPGHEAELDLGQAHLGRARGKDDVAAEHELETAAEGIAVDRGDDRFPVALDRGVHAFAARLEIVEIGLALRGVFLDVGAGHEAAALAGDDDDVGADILAEGLEHLRDLGLHARADRVELLGAPEGDHGDAAVALEGEGFLGDEDGHARRSGVTAEVGAWSVVRGSLPLAASTSP